MRDIIVYRNDPLVKELRKRAYKTIKKLPIRGNSPRALFNTQLEIIDNLLAIEENLIYCRESRSAAIKKATTTALEAKNAKGEIPDETKKVIKELQLDADDFAISIRLLRYGRWLFRYIGDAVAWKSYHYYRQVIRALGSKEPVPFVSKKEFFDEEIRFFKAARNLGKDWLPVMHDITNCLRTGDYSFFHKGFLQRLFELKITGKGKEEVDLPIPKNYRGRVKRQEERLSNIQKFFRTGELSYIYPNHPGYYVRSAFPEIHNFDSISKTIKLARKRGFGYQEPEKGLLYSAWDLNKSSENILIKNAKKDHPHIFDTLCTFRSISPRYESYHLSLPITAMQIPARDIIDILFGDIALIVSVNLRCLEEFCEENSLPLKVEIQDGGGFSIKVRYSDDYYGEVGEGLWDRVMLEGLSLYSFSGLIKSLMESEREKSIPKT